MLKLKDCIVKKSYTFFIKTANYIICVKTAVFCMYFNILEAQIRIISFSLFRIKE